MYANSPLCIHKAPSIAKERQAHNDAHGALMHEIIEVNSNFVHDFLGRIGDPSPNEDGQVEIDSAFRAIMFTDLGDSTKMTNRFGDARAVEMLREHNAIIRQAS